MLKGIKQYEEINQKLSSPEALRLGYHIHKTNQLHEEGAAQYSPLPSLLYSY